MRGLTKNEESFTATCCFCRHARHEVPTVDLAMEDVDIAIVHVILKAAGWVVTAEYEDRNGLMDDSLICGSCDSLIARRFPSKIAMDVSLAVNAGIVRVRVEEEAE